MRTFVLGASRIIYLAAMGVAFFAAATRADPAELGVYALAASYAAIVGIALNAGLDRVVFIRAVEHPTAPLGAAVRRARLLGTGLVVLVVVASGAQPAVLGAAAVVITRLRLMDLEAVSLGRGHAHLVSTATLANAAIGAPLTIAAAPLGADWLLWASAAGNAVAVAVLSTGRPSEPAGQPLTPIALADAWQFAAISLVGVLYLRGGMSLLPLRGISAAEIASFAVAFKAFEFVVAARGALVQKLAADLITRGSEASTRAVTAAVAGLGIVLSVAGLASARILDGLGVLGDYAGVWGLVGLVAACAPLIMSHAVTSAFVYSRPGRVVLLRDSAILAGVALSAVFLAAGTGIGWVVAVTCAMEYCSFIVFAWRFRDEGFDLRLSIVVTPLLASVVPLAAWGALSWT